MRLALLVADLGHLPERQRSALVMRELSGLSHAEIACALGVSLSGAKQAICEARVGLQEFAKGREMGCAEIQRLISDADGRRLRGRAVRAHLRSCGDCRALGDAIEQRRCDLAALAPALPAATATGLLARLFGVVGHASGGGATATAAATTGKAASGALAGKLAAGAVVLATVVVGAPNIVEQLSKHSAAGANHSTPAVRRAAVGAPAPSPAAPGRATSDHGVRTSSRNSAADRHRRSASGSRTARRQARRQRDQIPQTGAAQRRPRRPSPTARAPIRPEQSSQAPSRPTVPTKPSSTRPSTSARPAVPRAPTATRDSPPAADGNPRSADEPTTPGSNASADARPAPDTTPKLGRETEPVAPPTPTSTATPSSISPGDTAPTTPPAGNPTAPPTDNRSASGTRATPDRPLTNQGG